MSITHRFFAIVSIILTTFSIGGAHAADGGNTSVLSNCPAPSYDEKALVREQEGLVKLALMLGVDGKIMDAKVLSSSGHTRLDNASLHAVQGCTFNPGLKAAQNSSSNVTFSWVLN
jgi:TonB family protein